ncbi:MAG: hypothetical protein U5Q03_11820 [Bacteroidota bacterium]|nr:hypothetical protein [Bacteroidota bacterium]
MIKIFNLLLLSIFFHFLLNAQNAPGRSVEVDIGLFNSDCSSFEVRLKANENINSSLTNLQFTIKWPENSVELINFASDLNLEQQGPVFTSNSHNYAVFATVPTGSEPVNWLADEEYLVMSFEHDQSGNEAIDIVIAQDSWTGQNNGEYYLELLGSDYTGSVYHNASNVYTGVCIDIGLFNPVCAKLEVKLRPGADVDSYLSNIQFTVKWPAGTVSLINASSDFGIEQQGPVVTHENFNYAVYAAAPTSSGGINWNAGEEYRILSFEHDQTGSGNADFVIAQDAWSSQNNGMYYAELLGTDASGIVYHDATETYIGNCNETSLRVILQGAYDEGSGCMRNDINTAGSLPLTQPYNMAPWNYGGIESVQSLADSIVDWIIVELRDENDAGKLIDQRAALLSKNGIVLDTDFSEELRFETSAGNYYLVVKHRNHVPVMSGNTCLTSQYHRSLRLHRDCHYSTLSA